MCHFVCCCYFFPILPFFVVHCEKVQIVHNVESVTRMWNISMFFDNHYDIKECAHFDIWSLWFYVFNVFKEGFQLFVIFIYFCISPSSNVPHLTLITVVQIISSHYKTEKYSVIWTITVIGTTIEMETSLIIGLEAISLLLQLPGICCHQN